MRYCYVGTSFERRGRRVTLAQPSQIFDCPHCEYVMTALTEEAITTVRDAHIRTVHPDDLVDMRFLDAFNDGRDM